jgi:hypothetical protein
MSEIKKTDKNECETVLKIGFKRAVRMPWADLLVPTAWDASSNRYIRANKENAPKNLNYKYRATLLIPEDHEDLAAHKKAVESLLKARWGNLLERNAEKKKFFVDDMPVTLPFSSGDKRFESALAKGKDESFCLGHTILSTSNGFPLPIADARNRSEKGRPALVGFSGTSKPEELERLKAITYGGCFVAAEVKYRTNRAANGPARVSAYIQAVCFVHDGDRIGGAGYRDDTFDQVQGAVTDADITGGAELDDEVAF